MTFVGKIGVQDLQTLYVLGQLPGLTIRDEDDAIDALQHQLARRGVVDLTGNRIELETRGEAGDGAKIERQEIEEKRSIGLRREGDHFPFTLFGQLRVDVLQIRRLSRSPGAVVDDLARDFARAVVDDGHSTFFLSGRRARRDFD